MKRVLSILAPPFIVLALIAALLHYWAIPRFETWALKNIRSYSEKKLPVIIDAKSIKFKLIKPSATLESITLTTKESAAQITPNISLKSASIHLDLFRLFTGQLHISTVVIDSIENTVQIDPLLEKSGPSKDLPLKLIFEWLNKIPLDRVLFNNLQMQISSKKLKSTVFLNGGDLLLSNHRNSISARMHAPQLEFTANGSPPVLALLNFLIVLDPNQLKVVEAETRQDDSSAYIKGIFKDFEKVMIHPKAQLELTGNLKLDQIRQQLKPFLPTYKLPPIHGFSTINIKVGVDGLDKLSGTMDLKTNNVSIDSFALGNASVQGVFKENSLTLSTAEVLHPAGKAQLINTQLQLDENLSFKTQLKVYNLDLQKLFTTLNLNQVPVWMDLQGELPCQGQFKMPFKIRCEGSLQADNLLVTSNHGDKRAVIVDIEKISAKGFTEITDTAVSYKAQLNIAENTGESSGLIEYSKGFDISYKTPRLDLLAVRNLANLNIQGSTSIEGATRGNSQAAIFDMKIKAQDFSLAGYHFGQLNGNLNYKKSHLYINDIYGLLTKSSYNGAIDIDLKESKILGRIRAPTLDLSDLVSVFEKVYHFPVTVDGSGSAEASFSGPLNFWKLSYQLDSKIKNGHLAGELFDELNINAQATQGQMLIQNATLKKAGGTLSSTGGINAEKEVNLKLEGRNFRLDDSDFINKISPNIFGVLNFTSLIRGQINEPDVSLRGSITETVLDEQEIPSSFFDLKIRKTLMEGNANFFGHRIQADWLLPFNNSPMRLRIKTVDWNYASIFSIIGGNSLQNEYDSSLTTDIDLRSESGQWQKTSGIIQIKNIFLKRGNHSFRNSEPIQVKLQDGLISISHFNLEGPQNSIQVHGQNFTLNDLNVNVVANTELRLYHMFFPFLDDIGGAVQTSATISGSLFKPQILGNLSTSNSLVKIKGFPHAIERIRAEINFSQTKVLVNSIEAQMAGGLVRGDGSITIKEYQDIPTSIRISLEDVNLNIPDKVYTSGSADLVLSGKWFPFLLSGTYRVSSGVFSREFTAETNSGPNVRQSVYLPKILRQSNFEPLAFDIQILFERSFLVKNTMVEGAVQGNLQFKGPLNNPTLIGKLQTDRNSKLTFKDKVFNIQTGTVQFNSLNEINPDLYVSANTRVSDYDIHLLAQGPAKNLRDIRLTSVPPLSEQDIVSLLALGMTSSRMDQSIGGKEQAAQTGYELGFAIFSQTVNKQFQDRLGLNVQFTSSFDSTRNISVPKMTLSRKLSNKVNASLSRTLGSEQSNEAKLQYLINQNVSAIGSYQDTSNSRTQGLTTGEAPKENIFGLDLEFKKEFK